MACFNRKAITFVGVALISVSSAFAGGYQLNEHGARAVSMGGAFVARAWDASAIYFNPAGLSYVKGLNVMLGGTLILPNTTFTGPYPNNTEWKMNSISFFPPNAYVSYNFNNGLAAGVGVFTPDGLGTDWPRNWVGKFLITKINLQSFNINPTVSYEYGNFISVGVGFDYALGNVLLQKYNPTPVSDASGNPITPFVDMSGDAKGTGYNFGLMLKPTDNISVGFTYRSKIDFKTDNGNVTFSDAGVLAGELPGGAVSTSLPFPANWYLGVAYKGENYSVEADYQYIYWSVYKQLDISFKTQTALQQNTSIVGDYVNTYAVRVGGEYNLNKMWALRAGVFYDKAAVPDAYESPMLPDADEIGLNLGVGVNLTNHFAVDASYMFLPFKQRTIRNSVDGFNGTYNTTANLIGIDLSYRL